MRILCLGIGTTGSTDYTYSDLNTSLIPTIFDYDMVVMDLTTLNSSWINELSEKKEEFKKLFQSRGVCFVLSTSKEIREDLSNYHWCPFENKLKIENVNGSTLFVQDKNAESFFKSFNFFWQAIFSTFPEDTTVLAINRADDPISIIVPCEDGFCVFLPHPNFLPHSNYEKIFLDMLFEKGMNLIPETEKTVAGTIPPWAKEYMTENELTLLKSFNEIENKLGKYTKFKALLWETGPNLENLVISLFEAMGIKVDKLSSGSHADFECQLSEDLIGVFEVKGLSGNANRRAMRQLLDYFVEQRDIELRSVKGILIVNHFKNNKPSERGEPATQDAFDLARKHNFVILPTTKLYKLFVSYLENHFSKDEFLRQLAR